MPYDFSFLLYLGIALSSLVLLAMLTFSFSIKVINFPWQKPLILSIFTTICLLGVAVGVFPSKCLRMIHFRNQDKISKKTEQTSTGMKNKLVGHHPTCKNFSAHILRFKNKTYCSGCTGLVTGATISLIGSFLYFLSDFHTIVTSIFVFWLGFIFVVCGLLQHRIFLWNKGSIHFLLNVIFVLGAFLLIVGVNEITHNFLLETYLLISIIYWIVTRIILSQSEHKKICATCGLKLCHYH